VDDFAFAIHFHEHCHCSLHNKTTVDFQHGAPKMFDPREKNLFDDADTQ
jgi:hypothetical protein